MFNVYLYNFAKKYNSTKTPDDETPFITASCELKDGTSVINPTLILRMSGNPVEYNYAYIGAFRRRYYVENWRWAFGNWEADLRVDVLGSYATYIGDSTQYILRASSLYDDTILDTLYPATTDDNQSTVVSSAIWANDFSGGRLVVGVANSDTVGVGAVSYYVFTPSGFKSLCASLLSNTDWLAIEDISSSLTKALVNPLSYIYSVNWFPRSDVPIYTGAISSITFGWWTVPVTGCQKMASSVLPINFTLSIPKHPQAGTRGRYCNCSPYTRYSLELQPFGTLPIDASKINNNTALSISILIDCITGVGVLHVTGDSGQTVISTTAQVGVPMPIAQSTQDILGGASSLISTAGSAMGAAMHGDIAGVISSAASGIASAVSTVAPQMTISGAVGSTVYTLLNGAYLHAQFFRLVGEGKEHLGRPLCAYTKINNLSGYILCADSELDCTATDAEKREIKAFMDSGFYYEV